MSEMRHKKRAAEHQLTRDDDSERDGDEEFVNTPQIADEAEMATRRVVKVRRPEGGATATASSSSGGFFKDVAGSAPATAAPAKPAFGFGFGTASGTATATAAAPMAFSFGAPAPTPSSSSAPSASADAPAKPSFGFPAPTAAAPVSFSFGSAPAPTAPAPAANGFGFSAKPMAFSFGAPAAPSADSAEAAPAVAPLSFGAAPTPSTASTAAAPAAAAAAEAVAPKAEGKKFVFGEGSFNFGSAVNSFVAARTKLQEDGKAAKPDADGAVAESTAESKESGEADDEDKPDPAGFGSEIVEQTARDVLASAPSKLYLFKKGEDGAQGSWVERGTGDAKLISQPASDDDAAEHVYRLLVRGGYSLNATIKKNTLALSKTEAKHLILVAASADGPQTYLLKFTGPNAEANTKTFAGQLSKVVEEVSKAA